MITFEFRAWHIKRKKFYHNIERILIEKQSGGLQENNFGAWLNMEKQGKVIIEQYTGLKDKNGVEIYEGDLVKMIGYILKIIFLEEKGAYKMEHTQLEYDAPLELTSFKTPGIEIIGNIHE